MGRIPVQIIVSVIFTFELAHEAMGESSLVVVRSSSS
jgi:hypothetical protein